MCNMRVSVAVTSAALAAASASMIVVEAFAPSPNFRPRRAAATLSLLPDPAMAASAVESSSLVTGAVMESLGSLALLGSVGFGIAFSNSQNKDWNYEYKGGSGYTDSAKDLALLEEDPVSVIEKVEEEEAAAEPEPVAVADEPEPEPEPEPPVPEVVPEPAKASTPSKELLESTEKAKAEVVKKGVAETKEKMSAKETPPPAAEKKEEKKEEPASTEVAETKKPGAKRRFAKGMTLILAAGAVALARNVVKAYLGRGML